jgi:hypothetical protein
MHEIIKRAKGIRLRGIVRDSRGGQYDHVGVRRTICRRDGLGFENHGRWLGEQYRLLAEPVWGLGVYGGNLQVRVLGATAACWLFLRWAS